MPHETTTATKDASTDFPARPAGHSIGGMVAIEPGSPARLSEASIVAPPAFPGLALVVPHDTGMVIETLVAQAVGELIGADRLATETTFGPAAGQMMAAGLDRSTARAVARWGSGLWHLSLRIGDARRAVEWHSGKPARMAAKLAAADRLDAMLASRRASQWGGVGLVKKVRDGILTRPDPPMPQDDGEAKSARLEAHQLEGRIQTLLTAGGAPSVVAVGLAALFDPAGWSDTSAMLAGELSEGAKERRYWRDHLDCTTRAATRWLIKAWQVQPPAPVDFSHVPTLGFLA